MQAQTVTILDASTGRHIAGKLIKQYAKGVTIEDARDIRYYATLDRVIDGLHPAAPAARLAPLAPLPGAVLTPGDNGSLWQ
jgi:hypothetical protein